MVYKCTNLRSIKNLAALRSATTFPDGSFRYLSNLESIDLSPLTSLTEISSAFLGDCYRLKSLKFVPNKNLIQIKLSFLVNAISLTSLDLSEYTITGEGLVAAASPLGASFLKGCSNLKSLKLPTIAEGKKVGSAFLSGCSSLTELDLTPVENAAIGSGTSAGIMTNGFQNCDNLTKIKTGKLSTGNFNVSKQNYIDSYFTTTNPDAKCYTQGITIEGENQAAIVAQFADLTTGPYRKLVEAQS